MPSHHPYLFARQEDYEHYLKCECGFEGFAADWKHDYKSYGFGQDVDVEPMDFCPQCGQSEEFAIEFVTCERECRKCNDRFSCYTTLQLPKKNESLEGKAINFIWKLICEGIPKDALCTNDFKACPTAKVYVTIPYGRRGGGKKREYCQWNKKTVRSALKFWNKYKGG